MTALIRERAETKTTPRVTARRRVIRTDIAPAHVRALLLLIGLAVAISVGYLIISAPRAPEPPAAPRPSQATVKVEVFVHVAGDVVHPGVISLPLGSRVIDAISAAGGVLPGADTTSINLARVIEDGEQILVGRAGMNTPALLDLNAATAEELDRLPGVGPVIAARIITWRSEHGRFRSVEQLKDVAGVGASTFASLRKLIVVR